ncbi:hypothetical protein MKZ38_005788 [Zalerion maritima]|uniref:Glucanase n=1 Tax=Zalerion maritima TaxID=339359 RepID=A0AAD5RVY6_9PEZI|nr:hypothetical protein MKZ38_005788 [Zalerion maritima]
MVYLTLQLIILYFPAAPAPTSPTANRSTPPRGRTSCTEYSNCWDENHYTLSLSLSPYLEAEGLPANFIVGQGRVAPPGAREEWGEWCNAEPAGFGMVPGTETNNTHIDGIVWIKPGGESDGECGLEGATPAGSWFEEYVQIPVENTDASIMAA